MELHTPHYTSARRSRDGDLDDSTPVHGGVPALAVRAGDPVTRQGVTTYFRSHPQVELLDDHDRFRADTVVMLDTDVTSATMAQIREEAKRTTNPEMRIILVANMMTESQLVDAIAHGLVSFLPRRQTGMQHILAAVLSSWAGHAHLPGGLVRKLIEDLRALHTAHTPALTLTEREIDIVRLLAEGWTTEEIAHKLGYSDRTIKNAIHSLNSRLGLRNRAHAVGYGAQLGIL